MKFGEHVKNIKSIFLFLSVFRIDLRIKYMYSGSDDKNDIKTETCVFETLKELAGYTKNLSKLYIRYKLFLI